MDVGKQSEDPRHYDFNRGISNTWSYSKQNHTWIWAVRGRPARQGGSLRPSSAWPGKKRRAARQGAEVRYQRARVQNRRQRGLIGTKEPLIADASRSSQNNRAPILQTALLVHFVLRREKLGRAPKKDNKADNGHLGFESAA